MIDGKSTEYLLGQAVAGIQNIESHMMSVEKHLASLNGTVGKQAERISTVEATCQERVKQVACLPAGTSRKTIAATSGISGFFGIAIGAVLDYIFKRGV